MMDPTIPALQPGDAAYAGQATYTPSFLAHVYDPLVVHFTNRLIWRCPAGVVGALYDRHAGAAHLDVGPGTGYHLARARFPSTGSAITLLDPNADVLAAAAARIEQRAPRLVRASVLDPIALPAASFDSVAMTHVVHCLPGDLESKARAFANVRPLLRPGGRLFGSTVLADGVRHTPLSRRVMGSLNRKGIFGNATDDLAGLERALRAEFTDVRIDVRGVVALFVAHS